MFLDGAFFVDPPLLSGAELDFEGLGISLGFDLDYMFLENAGTGYDAWPDVAFKTTSASSPPAPTSAPLEGSGNKTLFSLLPSTLEALPDLIPATDHALVEHPLQSHQIAASSTTSMPGIPASQFV